MVKDWQKQPFLLCRDVQWPKMDISGSRGLKIFLSQVGSRVTLDGDKSWFPAIFSGFWDPVGKRSALKWRFGDFEVPPDWKEGVKSKNCYDRSISRAKLPPCTNFQRKIRQNVIGYTLGFFCTIIFNEHVYYFYHKTHSKKLQSGNSNRILRPFRSDYYQVSSTHR